MSTNNSPDAPGCEELPKRGIPLAFGTMASEIQVGLIPCSLHSGVQSCSKFWPDLLASPLISHCQNAFCSFPPMLLLNGNNCWAPQLILNPPQQRSCHFPSISPLPFLMIFFLLVFFSLSLVTAPYFSSLSNKADLLAVSSVTKDDFLCIHDLTTEDSPRVVSEVCLLSHAYGTFYEGLMPDSLRSSWSFKHLPGVWGLLYASLQDDYHISEYCNASFTQW